MVIHNRFEDLNLKDPFVTVGIFDGVHLGHKALIDHLALRAKRSGGTSVVVTFEPHPRLVLSENPEGFQYLSTSDEKKKLLSQLGIDHLVILKFTKELGKMEACDFIGEILVKRIGVSHLVVGYDNHFGKDRRGDFKTISECAEHFGFEAEQIDSLSGPEGVISSTSVRDALLGGKPELASKLLGYNYSMTGRVVEGRKLGRSLGFPTANIKPEDKFKLIPADGVYAVEVLVEDQKLKGMLSIGFNPTVNKIRTEKFVEAHIFDLNRDLYQQTITVVFRYRIRDEMEFENAEKLTDQMKADKQTAMRLLE